MNFEEKVASITQTGLDWHRETILRNSIRNAEFVERTIRDVLPDSRRCLIVSAGPSLYRERILSRIEGFNGSVVATDGAYIQCLKAGITPDWVITLDPHPTRMVRWFGDPDFEENSRDDPYHQRTRPDWNFNEANTEALTLVDANRVPLVIATTAPQNVVERTKHHERFWFVPLVDTPIKGSLTRIMAAATGCPALNTGGTVGTAAWAFAHVILKSPDIAIVGADYGYYESTDLSATQEWEMLKDEPNVEELFPFVETPRGRCRTSVTYTWYAQNFKDLLESTGARVTNCSEHGILYGERITDKSIEQWLS